MYNQPLFLHALSRIAAGLGYDKPVSGFHREHRMTCADGQAPRQAPNPSRYEPTMAPTTTARAARITPNHPMRSPCRVDLASLRASA